MQDCYTENRKLYFCKKTGRIKDNGIPADRQCDSDRVYSGYEMYLE